MRTIGTCLTGGIALAIITMHPVQLNAQRTRYKLIDLGTFGGPQSYIADGADITAVAVVNNKGIFTGWADTSASDPFPDFCFDGDCLVAHAFLGGKSRKKDLGVLSGGASSDTAWIADHGLISGDSQNGEIDPLIPGFPGVRAVLLSADYTRWRRATCSYPPP